MKKLMASDIDGTFLRGDITEINKNIEAVKKWREAGNIFVFATGRDWIGVEDSVQIYGLEYDLLVALNGAYICDTKGNAIYKESIDSEVAREIVESIKEVSNGQVIIQNGVDGCYIINSSENDQTIQALHERAKSIYKYTPEEALQRQVVAVGCRLPSKELVKPVCDRLNVEYKDYVNACINTVYVCVAPKGMDKSVGVEKVRLHFGIEKSQVFTIGDDFNDIEMLEEFHGAAMDTGISQVKKAAALTVTSVHEFIEKNL